MGNKTTALPGPAPWLGEQACLSKDKEEKPQAAAGLACAAPEIGAELSELGPAGRILVLALNSIPLFRRGIQNKVVYWSSTNVGRPPKQVKKSLVCAVLGPQTT